MFCKHTAVKVLIVLILATCSRAAQVYLFRPCGNDLATFIQFGKMSDSTENTWMAAINLDFYELKQAFIEILFEPLATVGTVYDSCQITVTGNNFTGHYWTFKPSKGMHDVYKFDVKLGPGVRFPYIRKLNVNGQTVCENQPQMSQSINLNARQNQAQNNAAPQIQCGRRPANFVNLIYQGDESDAGQWPWHVAIYIQKYKHDNKTYHCGGTLISKNMVLTAAHCVMRGGYPMDPRKIFVVAGKTALSRTNDGSQESPGRQIIVYPFYNGKPGTGDIAIIKTFYCFNLNDYVQTACVSSPPYNKAALYGLYGTVVGFGVTENDTLSDAMRHTEVQIQNDATCLASDIVYQSLINEFNFCAGNGPNSNVNPCNGDSGGGLVIEYDNGNQKYWTLVGIVSVAKRHSTTNRCDPSQYVVYTSVTAYSQWISSYW